MAGNKTPKSWQAPHEALVEMLAEFTGARTGWHWHARGGATGARAGVTRARARWGTGARAGGHWRARGGDMGARAGGHWHARGGDTGMRAGWHYAVHERVGHKTPSVCPSAENLVLCALMLSGVRIVALCYPRLVKRV